MAKTYKITIELSTEATLQLFKLEGYVIALSRTLDNAYRIAINDFPIDGELDYYVHCTGWNKTAWALKISIDDKDVTPEPIRGIIEKGYSTVRGEIKF